LATTNKEVLSLPEGATSSLPSSHSSVNICESVLSLKAYQGGKPISELQRELGLDEVVKLASNENPLPVSNKVRY
jgi:hypothetical protein